MSKLHLFYGGPFSQWYSSDFVIDEVVYNCAEQFMMAEKAKLFGDEDALEKIMAARHPAEQKRLGRIVKGFDASIWNLVAKDVVYKANLAKFIQNRDILKFMRDTGDDILVEASPTDKIWGIGLDEYDPRALDPAQWQGTNWLGEVLMKVRDSLR